MGAFEQAMLKARTAAAKPRKSGDGDRARDKAEQALTRAARARAGALAARAKRTNPGVFQQGEALYGSAREAFDRDDYRGTRRLALDAVRAYEESAAKGTGRFTATLGALGSAPGGSGIGSVISSPERIEALIVALRFKRAEMLGNGQNDSCPAVFKEFEAIVDLAHERFQAGDLAFAAEFAVRAQERVRRCEAKWAAPLSKAEDKVTALKRQRATKALQRAQAAFARALSINADDPKVRQGEALIRNAERWFDRGSFGQAETLANTAERTLQGVRAEAVKPAKAAGATRDAAEVALAEAQTLLARVQDRLGFGDDRLQEPENMITKAERWFDDERYGQAAKQAKAATGRLRKLLRARPKAAAKKPAAAPTEGEQRAAKALDRAQEAQLEALERVSDPNKLRKGDRYLKLAERSFEGGKWWQATDQARKALREYRRLGATKPGVDKPRKKPRTNAEACRQAPTALRETARLARNTSGDHLSTDQARRHDQATGLLRSARRRLERRQCTKALAEVNRAADLLMDLPYPSGLRPDIARGAKPLGGDEPDEDGAWQAAYDAAQQALKARDRARRKLAPSMKRTYKRGVALLAASRDDYESAAYDEALRNAEGALAQFEAVIAAGGDEEPEPTVDDEGATRPTKPTKRRKPSKPKTEPWRGPYYAVYSALAMRDRAIAAAKTPEHDEAIELGSAQLRKARRAWEDDDWAQAAALARKATASFRKVFAKPASKDGDGPDKPKDAAKATYEQAEAAVREAKVVLQVCERDQCDDRDFPAFTSAKETVASAEKNLAAKRFGYAVKLGEEARDELRAILAKPRKSKPAPTVDPDAQRAAEEAIRNAEIQRQLCEQKRDCKAIDLEAYLHAQKDLSAAQSALADGAVERAGRLADKASGAFQTIQATAPKFVIPPGVSSVTRSGDQLYLNPPIKFGSGQTQLEGASQTVVQDLATVVKHNISQISSVQILGFTDSRGNAAINKNISGARAKSVRQALTGAGVPAGLISSEGRGPDNPIADNGTPEGRAANRRVEIHFQQK